MSRLTPERTVELYRHVLRLLTDVGYDKLTMDAVAEQARSSKATLYRQWGSKERLVVEAIGALAPDPPTIPDTGSFRSDFIELQARTDDALESDDLALIPAVLHACRTNDSLAVSLHEHLVAGRVETLRELIDRAVARGEVAAGNPAIDFFAISLIGPAMLREVVEGVPSDPAYVLAFLDAVLIPALGITRPEN
ncbi:AcrR family transcriptional regulator [Mumia flava]|uniref:AcrR family transcriptional regulator n=1 Tax=Mumia flava TaxID=1348852 RepID=A0A0B2BQF5_9ACTN|nr:TetR/AcrR family transcriptional regulator [Mumia flava]PJJ58010.1 AcrR family transcriptional regulator [Mumia flava]